MKIIVSYIATLLPIIILDLVWLVVVAKNFYAKHLGFLMTQQINWVPAAVFYPVYALAVVYLAVLPALDSGLWHQALLRGALLGLAAYSAYDLTNHATIPQWPLVVTVVDIGWGVFVTALASVASFFFLSKIL